MNKLLLSILVFVFLIGCEEEAIKTVKHVGEKEYTLNCTYNSSNEELTCCKINAPKDCFHWPMIKATTDQVTLNNAGISFSITTEYYLEKPNSNSCMKFALWLDSSNPAIYSQCLDGSLFKESGAK